MRIIRISAYKIKEDDIVQANYKGQPHQGKVHWVDGDDIYVHFFDLERIQNLYEEGINEQKNINILEWMEMPFKVSDIAIIEKSLDWGNLDHELDFVKEEKFHYYMNSWDIREAKRLLYKNPRDKNKFDVNSVKNMATGGSINIDPELAMKSDLNVPLIVLSDGLPIDGWHRIYRAVKEDVDFLPAYVLTDEEEKIIKE